MNTENRPELDLASALGLDGLRFDPASGLLPAIIQSADDGSVLMLGWMNEAALARTIERRRVTFWSRSREELWEKGATSGNWLEAVSIAADCDQDALLVTAVPHGPTCHTGRRSCFDGGAATATARDARSSTLGTAMQELEARIAERHRDRPAGSYTASLFDAGRERIAQKVGEEAVETVIAALGDADGASGSAELIAESADLLYHLLVLWKAMGIEGSRVAAELRRRDGPHP